MKTRNGDLSHLNRAQREAVAHVGGPLLIIAGAGTGKTAVITERIAWLIREQGNKPESILALTFTEKAAEEMEERLDMLLPLGFSRVQIKTFHGFCETTLREFAIEIGLDPSFKILTGPQQWLLLRRHLFELPLKYFRPLGNPTKFLVAIIRAIGAAKDADLKPENFLAHSQNLKDESEKITDEEEQKALLEESEKWHEFALVYREYNRILISESAMDFGDIILNTLNLFKERPSILKKVRERLSEVLVDEFQDTNGAQVELLRMLVPDSNGAITVVGDDDQSIYAWRGSNLTNILFFQEWYPNAKKIVLTENYRSPQKLLDSAYTLIQKNNPLRLEKTANVDKKLRSNINVNREDSIFHYHFPTVERETAFIAEKILSLSEQKDFSFKDAAVLTRTNSQIDFIVPALAQYNIPYHVAESRGLLLRPEIRDIIAYLRCLLNPEDAVSLFRIISVPSFGLHPLDRQKLLSSAKRQNLPLFFMLKKSDQVSDSVKKVLGLMEEHLASISSKRVSQIILEFLHQSGYLDALLKDAEKHPETIPNLNEFMNFVAEYERSSPDSSFIGFMEYLDLVAASGESPSQALFGSDVDAVRIFTVHAAKGLEFSYVFIQGATDDKYPVRERREMLELPKIFSAQDIDPKEAHIAEERRLFYVALTRAKKQLFITTSEKSNTQKTRKKVSPFMDEANIKTIISQEKQIEQLSLPIIADPIKTSPRKLELPQTVSVSQIETYENCPLRYQFQYIYKIPTPAHYSLTYGITIHNVFKELARITYSGRKANFEQAFELYEKFWSSEGFESQKHEVERKEKGREQLKIYIDNHPDIISKAPLYFEQSFRFKLGNFNMIGRIDRVDKNDNEIVVLDYKTGSAKDQKTADKDLQLSVYAIALIKAFNLTPSRYVLSYFDEGVDRVTTRKREQLKKAEERCLTAVENIQQQNFEAKPDFIKCGYCPFKGICDESAV